MTSLIDRAKRLIDRRPASTEGHTETARETGVMLGLMKTAAAAGPEMTDEQRLLLIDGAPGMRRREAMLLAVPNRSSEQEAELHMIRREMAVIDGREPVQSVSAPRRFFAPLAAAGPWSLLLTPWTLVVAGLALTGVQTARLNHAKADLSVRTHELHQAVENAHEWQERSEHYRQGLVDAANVAHQAAAALDAERAAQARAAARERRRNRELANVLAHSPDAPAWRLRDDEPPADQPTTPPS